MLTTSIKLADKYDYLADKFAKAYAFLRTQDLSALPLGVIEIDGRDVFASVQEYTTEPWEKRILEAHDKYFDIQYVVEGREIFGYVKRDGLTERIPYNSERDVVVFEDPKDCGKIFLEAGDFAIVPPEDAHKPGCSAGESCKVRKVVIKVSV